MFHRQSPTQLSPNDTSIQTNDVIAICREISSTGLAAEKNVTIARIIINKLFKNPLIDMCSILPPVLQQHYNDSPYRHIHSLIHSQSPFFETILEDDQLCAELWDGILQQCEMSVAPTDPAKDSILFNIISQYVTRILPCDETLPTTNIPVPHSPKTTQQTIRTPLQLFRTSSPLINRINIEDRSHMMTESTVSFQPRLVQNFCDFVAKACTTAQFTNTNKLLLIRYLLKQFHVFCQFNSGDSDVDIWKLDLMSSAPFKRQLYEFFKSSISQVPTITVFKDITMCWLTYCRPWRYHNMTNAADFAQAPKYFAFFEKNYEFYEVILGKIIKRFAAFEMCEELIPSMRSIVEFAWREPQTLLLRHIQLDIQAHAHGLLAQMQKVVRMHRDSIKREKEEHSGFFASIFSAGDSPKQIQSKKLIAELLSLMKDSDSYTGTHLMDEMGETGLPGTANETAYGGDRLCTSLLNETPKSGLGLGIPDHYVDSQSNHMLLTPVGQKQVLNREKRFDYSKCARDDAQAPTRRNEVAFAVRFATFLAKKLNEIPVIRHVGDNYSQSNLTGLVARTLMYPPIPNLDPNATVPAYSARIQRTPPLLRIRYLASYQSIFLLIWLLLSFKFGTLFTIVTGLLIGLAVFCAFMIDMDSTCGSGGY